MSIIRLDDGLHFKIRCRQQNRTTENASVERNFRSLASRADRDSWCDDIERICADVRSNRSSINSSSGDMMVDASLQIQQQQQAKNLATESTDIDMPMVTELQDASKRLTMDSFERIKGQSHCVCRGQTHVKLCLCSVLGTGSFGQVFLVFRKNDPTQKRMAMKVVKKRVVRDFEELEHIRNERQGKPKKTCLLNSNN